MKQIMLQYELMWFKSVDGCMDICMDMYDYKRSTDTQRERETER